MKYLLWKEEKYKFRLIENEIEDTKIKRNSFLIYYQLVFLTIVSLFIVALSSLYYGNILLSKFFFGGCCLFLVMLVLILIDLLRSERKLEKLYVKKDKQESKRR